MLRRPCFSGGDCRLCGRVRQGVAANRVLAAVLAAAIQRPALSGYTELTSTEPAYLFEAPMLRTVVRFPDLRRIIAVATLFFLSGGWSAPLAAAEIDFTHEIAPILRTHCGKCHLGAKKEGGLSLNTRELLLAGGEDGKVVTPGKNGESELVRRILSSDPERRMPPEGLRVPPEKVALLKRWIEEGAKWDEGFAFQKSEYEPPLKPRKPALPPAVGGRDNPVDRIIDAYFAKEKIAPPAPAGDEVFLRRIYLDLIGLLPTPRQRDEFLTDRRTDKRQRLIRGLLDNDLAYAEHWLTFWNDLLRNDYTGTGFITGGRKQITTWLHRGLLENKPYDQFVRELIAPTPESEGFIQGIRWRGEVNASQTVEIQFAQNISQAFLGINMKCASCHDSFIDRWKLKDAYSLAAIYAQQPLPIHRCDKPTGTNGLPGWIFPELGQIQADAPQPERLKQLAQLMTHPENGRFTRTVVNRFWHRLLGRGIVHPVDAMHTEPWNSDLLDYLASQLAEDRYDLKKSLELICTSRAYQAQTPPQASPPPAASYVFHGPQARRLTAEQFVDAVWQLTGAAPNKPDAQVTRTKTKTKTAAGETKPPAGNPPAAQWIWAYRDVGSAPAGETIALRRRFQLPAAPTSSLAILTCDNEYALFVNGQKIGADANWETVESFPLTAALKAGDNELLIVAKNAGAGPNPAALYFTAKIQVAGQPEQLIVSDKSWEWTKSLPDAAGKFPAPPKDWQPAEATANEAIWAPQVQGQIASLWAQAGSSGEDGAPMMRASLVKCDALMHSLGRPNRDQIVSMRPADLTTLEAIDLANGPTLADFLTRGAQSLAAKFNSEPETLVRQLFQFALTRDPKAEELAAAREMLGPKPTEQNVQDLLWAIIMLPEFQLVR